MADDACDKPKKCDDASQCGSCPVHLYNTLSIGLRLHTEAAVANWLATMTHTPSCGLDTKGDLVRWQVIGGHRLPTVREDLVAAATSRQIAAHGVELVAFLTNALEPRTREMLALALAVTQ